MGRPSVTVTIEKPAFLVHLGELDSWTDCGNGFGDDREVSRVVASKMGKRPCRWLEEGDAVCIDLYRVTCPLCLKSNKVARECARLASNQVKPNRMTAEGRLFWKQLDERVKTRLAVTTPEERFRNYCALEHGRRVAFVARIEGRGTSKVKVVLG